MSSNPNTAVHTRENYAVVEKQPQEQASRGKGEMGGGGKGVVSHVIEHYNFWTTYSRSFVAFDLK